MKKKNRKDIFRNERTAIWVPKDFRYVRDRLSVDTGLSKEEVCSSLSNLLMDNYDEFKKDLLRSKSNNVNEVDFSSRIKTKKSFMDELRF